MSKEDLENILKFADDNNLMQEPFDKVYELWKNPNNILTSVSSNL